MSWRVLIVLLTFALTHPVFGHQGLGERMATPDVQRLNVYAPLAPTQFQPIPPNIFRPNYIYPVAGTLSRRGFGHHRDRFTRRSRLHAGQDFHAPYGSKVVSVKDGVVVKVVNWCASWSRNRSQRSCGGGFGNYVVIRHADGNHSYYAHLQHPSACPALNNFRPGQWVFQGDPIGCVGSSGLSTGPHLHFEIRVPGPRYHRSVNPLLFLRQR